VWDNTIIIFKSNENIEKGPRDAAKKIAQEIHNTRVDLLSMLEILRFFYLKNQNLKMFWSNSIVMN